MRSVRFSTALALLALLFMASVACESGAATPSEGEISPLAPTVDLEASSSNSASSDDQDDQQISEDTAAQSDDSPVIEEVSVNTDDDGPETEDSIADSSTPEAKETTESGDDESALESDDVDDAESKSVEGSSDSDAPEPDKASSDDDSAKADEDGMGPIPAQMNQAKAMRRLWPKKPALTMSVATKPHPEANEASGDGDKSDAEPVKSVAVTDDSEQEVILDYALTLEGNPLNPFDALFIRAAWQKNLDAAHVESECPAITPVEFPEGYYTGSLIDTHLHMPPISDEFGGDSDNVQSDVTGVDAAFYNSIAQDDRPVLGVTVTVDQIACTLKHEGTIQAFTFFPVYQDSPSALIDSAYKSVERHGALFVPYIQSTNSTTSGVNGEVLQQMLEIRPDFFAGLGEIGDSPTDPVNLPLDDPFYSSAFETAKANGLPVYFHPGVGDHENLERALQSFPEIIFIVHADFIRP